MKGKKIIVSLIVMIISAIISTTNVKAIEIQVDQTKPSSADPNSYLVTNDCDIHIYDSGYDSTIYIYKILNVYYNESSNEMSYDFTKNFQDFLDAQDSNLTIDDYFNLTSDDNDAYSKHSVITTSTLNKLLSKYAIYIKQNSASEDYIFDDRYSFSVKAGCYLLLADSTKSVYGVSIANVVFASEDGEWKFNTLDINVKAANNSLEFCALINTNFSEDDIPGFFDNIDDFSLDEAISIYKNKRFSYFATFNNLNMPSNMSEAIKNSPKLGTFVYEFPKTLKYDLNSIYILDDSPLKVTFNDGSCYINGTEKFADYTEETTENSKKLTIKYTISPDGSMFNRESVILFTNMYIDDPDFAAYKSYDIKQTKNFLVDAYTSDASEAFVESTETNTIYTYNLKLTNINTDSDKLSGAVFGIYTDQACTNQIGENITIGNAESMLFNGITEGTYYLKQEKAASGYRLMETNPMEFTLELDDLVDDEYFEITVTSPASLLLPFTGGSGTIIYTCFGFVVVILSGLGIYLYTKKHKAVLEN